MNRSSATTIVSAYLVRTINTNGHKPVFGLSIPWRPGTIVVKLFQFVGPSRGWIYNTKVYGQERGDQQAAQCTDREEEGKVCQSAQGKGRRWG